MVSHRPDDETGGPLELEAEDLPNGLDPNLQRVILNLRENGVQDAAVVSGTNGGQKVEVLAKLKDPAARVPGLDVVRRIGDGDIVTGTIALGDIERVRNHDNVVSLKAATELRPELVTSVSEVRCDAEHLRDAFSELASAPDGSGVIIGIVDYGCDFRHANFRRADDSTRLLYLWDQRRGQQPAGVAPQGFGYGRELDRAAIDEALRQSNPYEALGYLPERGAHGTHVMDIAAGNGRGTGQAGIAPGAELIFVHVAADDVNPKESLGNSRRLLEAVDYIFEKAAALGLPAVVNLSLGTHGGPHDGSTLVEQGFERLLDRDGRAIVISAGNAFNLKSHAQGAVVHSRPTELSWEIQPHDLTPNEMEVWYSGKGGLEVTLVAPDGKKLGPVPLGQTHKIVQGGKRRGEIIHRRNDPNNHDHQIDILLDNFLPSGTWKVMLSTHDHQPVPFHAWIERDDNGLSAFAATDAATSCTLGSICCGPRTIAVGSYDADNPQRPMSAFSSAGPTRDNRPKPEVSAPGEAILAAAAQADTTVMSGTSMAAPHVTGLIALLFQVAGPRPIDEVRRAVLETARLSPPTGNDDLRYGHGRISGVAALRSVLGQQPPTERMSRDLNLPERVVVVPTAANSSPSNGSAALSAFLTQMLSGTVDLRISVGPVEH